MGQTHSLSISGRAGEDSGASIQLLCSRYSFVQYSIVPIFNFSLFDCP